MNTPSVKLRNFYGSIKKHPNHIIYVWIVLTVVIFNLIAIFGIDILLHDDPTWYGSVLNGEFPQWMMKYNLIHGYKEWIVWHIMAYSPYLARGLYVVVLMVPISCCFYYLFHYTFGFSRTSAFTAAILPNILPYQWQIPAGINMSYVLWGLLFSIFSLILGLHYLEKTTSKNWIRLLGAVLCYFVASQLKEQSLFIFPPLVFAFSGYTKFNKKHIWLISSFFIVAIAKFIWVIAVPRKAIIDIPIEEMFRRIGFYFKWSLPSPHIEPIYITVIFFIIILFGFVLYIRDADSYLTRINKHFFHLKKNVYVLYVYTFFICWFVSSIFVFICMTEYRPPRHSYTSSFGLNAIFIFSIYAILNKGFFRKYKLHIFVLTAIVIFSGVSRYFNLKQIYTKKNQIQSIIFRDINKLKLPLNSQVVISGAAGLGVSLGWRPSSGCLKFVLKRKDIDGLVGPINYKGYYNFDNHFNPRERGWKPRYSMTGLSIDRPTFLFLMLKKRKKLIQFEYALQWKGKTKNAPWTILKLNKKTGKISPFISGIGMKAYLLTLKRLEKRGISQSEILWGGPPTEKELERLEKLELDPILFHSGFLYDQFNKIKRSRAEQFLSISNTIDPIAKNIYFENRFQLLSSFSDEVTNEDGSVCKIIHILWKSLAKQRLSEHKLAITLLKNRERIWGKMLEFYKPGTLLESGDYFFGSVKIPAGKFKKAKNLGIRVFDFKKAQKWTSLKIQGDHKTDQKGFRLLAPIK